MLLLLPQSALGFRGHASLCSLPERQSLRSSERRKCGVLAAYGDGPSTSSRQDGHSDLNWPENIESQYHLGKVLGTGAYGQVKLAVDRSSGRECAVKILPKQRKKLSKEKTLKKIAQEVEMTALLQFSKEVVGLQAVYEDLSCVYIVLELCSGGDLDGLLKARHHFTEQECALSLYECLKMVAACHSCDLVHGDIKPSNFLLKHSSRDPFQAVIDGKVEGPWLKAVDFGCSQLAMETPLMRRVGTPVYMAPEVFLRNYDTQCDMWSLGIMFYQLLCGRFPYWATREESEEQSLEEVMTAVMTETIPLDEGPWRRMSPAGLHFMRRLVERDPRRRITAEEALQHEWFRAWVPQAAARDAAARELLQNNIVPTGTRLACGHPAPAGTRLACGHPVLPAETPLACGHPAL